MFKQNKLRQESLSEGNVLAMQALSWTELNNKENFRVFIRQENLPQNGSLIETLILFNLFLNVYLHRLSEITKVVKIIQPLINEFVSIRKSITLGPSIRNYSQNKAVKEKVLLLRDRILAQAELLFNLKRMNALIISTNIFALIDQF